MQITTNNKPREIMSAGELTADERAMFDYLDWARIDAGEDSASFIRYRGELYDLGCCMRFSSGQHAPWQGYWGETFFSAVFARFTDDGERIVIGRATATD